MRAVSLLMLLTVPIAHGCGKDDDQGQPPPTATEADLLAGTWDITDSVTSTNAVFGSEGDYRIDIVYAGNTTTEEGTWAIEEPHMLVRTYEAQGLKMRNTDTIYVDETQLVIGGVLVRVSPGTEIQGDWVSVRVVENHGSHGYYLSSKVTRDVTLGDGGVGSLTATTERENSSGEPEDPTTERGTIQWTATGDTYRLSGALDGDYTLFDGVLVQLVNAYRRQAP